MARPILWEYSIDIEQGVWINEFFIQPIFFDFVHGEGHEVR